MLLHAFDAVQQGHQRILLQTVDADVLALAVAVFHHLSSMRPDEQLEIWLAFEIGINLRYIPAHSIASSLGPERSKALPAFHAFTGCDTILLCQTGQKDCNGSMEGVARSNERICVLVFSSCADQ